MAFTARILPFRRKALPGAEHPRPPRRRRLRRRALPIRGDVEAFLAIICPGESITAKLRKLLPAAFLWCGLPPETLIGHALGAGLSRQQAESLLGGRLDPEIGWSAIEATLLSCGAAPAHVEVLAELVRQKLAETTTPSETPTEERAPDSEPGTAAEVTAQSDPSTATTALELIGRAVNYRIATGEPSFKEMARIGGYGQTSLSELPKTTTLPSEPRLLAFIKGCGADDVELHKWKVARQRIAIAEEEARRRGTS
jgi:hypothetical protein